MKIYISVDIEGISGLRGGGEHDDARKHDEERDTDYAKKQMTADVNAAIEGALQAGASEIFVRDAHGSMYNLNPEELNKAARLLSGHGRAMNMVEGIDNAFDALFLIGYHGMAGSKSGIWAHTFSSVVEKLVINDMEFGEGSLSASLAGYYKVPTVLVSGDEAAVEEVKKLIPQAEGIIVKRRNDDGLSEIIHPEVARERIREAAVRILPAFDSIKPLLLESPIRIKLTLSKAEMAELVSFIPQVERIDAKTVSFTADDVMIAFKLFRVMLGVAWSAR
ncbi:MAG: M55 family metallopeptidase [Candidatus Poribacteria bacterium]